MITQNSAMDKVVLRMSSSTEFITSLFWRIAFIAVVVYLLSVYEQNLPVITVAIIITGLSIFLMGNDEIIIYSDRILKTDTSIVSLLWRSYGKVYLLKDIASASYIKEAKPGLTDMGIMAILSFILPNRMRRNTGSQFSLHFRSGQTVSITTDLNEKKIEKIVTMINSLV